MQLADYFAPWNITNFLIFILVFFTFDSLGFVIAYKLQLPNFLRLTNWFIGAAILVCIWFILHFFLPFSNLYVFASVLFLLIPSLPIYIRKGGPQSLIKTTASFPYPLIILLLVSQRLFLLTSLPPYAWDEMAYHFKSPAQLLLENSWSFSLNTDVYTMVPKMMEVSYWLLFSLSKTYVLARMYHLLIFISGIYTIALFIKKNLGLIPALVYSLLAFLLTQSILIDATTGYIDVAAAVFVNLFFICLLGWIIYTSWSYFYAVVIFFALAISVKYTVLGSLLALILITPFVYLGANRGKISFILSYLKQYRSYLEKIFIALIIAIIFGGYWYIKNIIATGNPIVPFFFPCSYGLSCGSENEFFSGWTIPFDFQHIPQLIDTIFQQNTLFLKTFLASLVFSFTASLVFKNKIVILILVSTLLAISIEFLLSMKISGFLPRYYYHWYLLIPLLISLAFYSNQKIHTSSFQIYFMFISLLSLLLLSTTGVIMAKNVLKLNSHNFMPDENMVRNYAEGKLSINGWVNGKFPNMGQTINWCGEKRPLTELYFADPKLIWYDYEGLMRVYLVNCSFRNIPYSKSITLDENSHLIKSSPNSIFTSLDNCLPTATNPYPDNSEAANQYNLNQSLVCAGKAEGNHLYSY
ncbi:MAG: hypothetical protein M1607_00160 [Patescibacteria group bacterium]|nr:hypothetical protein [Patescibacteria group bacterium]